MTIASWLLRVALLGHAVALFAIVFHTRQTQFGNLLFLELFDPRVGQAFFGFRLEDPYIAAVWVERVTVSLYLLAGVVALLKPWSLLLLLMAGYALTESLSGTLFGGYRFREWTVYSDTLRWGAPLALLVIVALPGVRALNRWRAPLATDLLRALVAMVFIIHGMQAWAANPAFIDLIIGTFGRTFGIGVGESTAVAMMKVIAVVDFAVALALLLLPSPVLVPQWLWRPSPEGVVRRIVVPSLLLWLAFWGFITAMSRITALGFSVGLSQYPELLMRTSHYIAPLALWWLFNATYGPARFRRSRADTTAGPSEPASDLTDASAPQAGPAGAITTMARTPATAPSKVDW